LEKLLKSNLFIRTLSASILGLIFIYALLFNHNLFLSISILIIVLSFVELSKIIQLDRYDILRNLFYGSIFLFLFLNFPYFFKIYITVFFIFICPLVIIKKFNFSLFYKYLPCAYLPSFFVAIFYLLNENPIFLLMVFLGIWSVDIGGYFFGRLFGRKKLFPKTSPKKTYEGLIGSSISLFLILIIMNLKYSLFSHTTLFLMFLSILIFSVFGDYFESYLKRRFDVKDSGYLIPGHGGILDRVDSALFAIPIIYLIL
jgi:phosphatidate cytidylyltransferase